MPSIPQHEPALQWWGAQRRRYNVALILAGFGAFIAYATLVWSFQDRLGDDVEITAFTILFQGMAYLFAIGVANICYFLGPLSECVIKPSNVDSFRKTTFRIGLWFSVLLPFLIPLLIAYDVARVA